MAVSFDKPASEVARRYAGALFSLARDKGELAGVLADLETLAAYVDFEDALPGMLKSAAVPRAHKVRALIAIAEKCSFSRLVSNFVGMVARNGRAGQLPEMIDVFKVLDARKRGVQRACVRTARPMTSGQRQRLTAILDRQFGKGLDLVTEVDPALVGGMCLHIGSRLIDASVSTRLTHMKNAMKGV